jgi:hypothetical protein
MATAASPASPGPAPPSPPPNVPAAAVNPPPPVLSSTVPLQVTTAPVVSSTAPLQVTLSPVSPPAAPPPQVAIIRPTPSSPQRLVIQFEDRSPALTPAGTQAFKEAVDALHGGKTVTIAIEGCDAKADFSNGSVCGRRRASLLALFAQNGVQDPQRLLADNH